MTVRGRLIQFFAVLALAAGSLVTLPAQPAAAANGCSGTVEAWNDWYDSAGRLAAKTYYYDEGANTCVNLVAQGIYYGQSKYMSIKLCDSYNSGCVSDSGTFLYYAGPVRRPADVCLWAVSTMKNSAGTTIVNKSTYVPPCN
ncbi:MULTISPECIES: hypothetical protein [Streptomyces]|uniref:Secreted protein n=1 Tax=Streptomyces solicathayae TaxID=3081768 RepID=A0ABZ0LMH1_9ACTN|nr:hypothetical protein [Streptomyces sp. HUAS YS2]WOX20688.1 hypothetical protein R2D22_04490 [Streptomyces sp. HUAS YS2]